MPTSSTASGCAASAGAWTPASSCAPRSRCSRAWASRRSPVAPSASCWRPATCPQTQRRDPRGAHRPGGSGRATRARRPVKRRDRRAAVHQPAHRRLPPTQGVHQARHHLAQPTRPGSTRRRWRPADGVIHYTNHATDWAPMTRCHAGDAVQTRRPRRRPPRSNWSQTRSRFHEFAEALRGVIGMPRFPLLARRGCLRER